MQLFGSRSYWITSATLMGALLTGNLLADPSKAYAKSTQLSPSPSPSAEVSALVPSVNPQTTIKSLPLPTVSADPKIIYGTLANRIATSHGITNAKIFSPVDRFISAVSSTKVIIDTEEGSLVTLKSNGEVVPESHIGSLTTDTEHHTARYVYYGVRLDSNANILEAISTNLDGKSTPSTITIYGPGRAQTFEQHLNGKLLADGKTTVSLEIQSYDAYHHPALPGANVKVTVVSGDARLLSPVSKLPLQTVDATTISGGGVSLLVLPGLTPGQVVIHLSANDVESEVSYGSSPNIRKPIVVGLATVGIGSVPGSLADSDGATNGVNSRKGRVALYASGGIGKKGLATISYDTADRLQRTTGSGSSASDPNNRPYQTYGDTSTIHNDALSRNHLYARYDQGESHALLGEFQAQTGSPNSVGGFSQLVNGVQVQIANKGRSLSVFNAKNNIAYARTVIPASGFSALTRPLHTDIVVGSEDISLIALDRRTGLVVSQTTLIRNVDYDLDYISGQLRFINIPFPYDNVFNPQQILIRYEYGGTSVNAHTIGGRLDVTLGKGEGGLKFGSGYVNDYSGQGSYNLTSEDITSRGKNLSFTLSHAASHGVIGFNDSSSNLALPNTPVVSSGIGQAWSGRVGLIGLNDKFETSFQSTTQGYVNPFGGLSTPGLLDYRFLYTHILGPHGSLVASYDTQKNNYLGNRSSQSRVQVRIREAVSKRITIFSGLVQSRSSQSIVSATTNPIQPSPPSINTSLQGEFGFDYRVTEHLALTLSRLQNLSRSASVSSSPNQSQGQISYDFSGKGRAYLQEIITDAPIQSFGASTSGLATAALGSTSATTFGFERSLGSATTVNEELQIDHSNTGDVVRAVSGIRERFRLGHTLKGDLAFQRAGGNAQSGFQTYSTSLDWHPTDRFKISSSYQSRTGSGNGSTLFVGAIGALTDDVSLFASINKSLGASFASTDSRVGLSVRPLQSDRLVTLLGYRSASGISSLGGRSDVFSVDQIFRPTHRLELVGRYAYKLDGDTYYAARTSVGGLRITQNIGRKADIGAEMSLIGSKSAPSVDKYGIALEAGLRITPSLRVAVGYNLTRIADPTLIGAPSKKGLYLTMSSLIDRIFGWGAY